MRPPLSFEKQVPLFVRFETRPIWSRVKDEFGADATGAAIIAALIEAHGIGRAWVSYSRSRTFYASRSCHPLLTFRRTVGAADALDAGGWIHHARQVPGGRGWQSAMAATEALVERFAQITRDIPLSLAMPRDVIVLRDADGRPIDHKPTRQADRMARQVEALNEAVTGAEVRTERGQNVASPMTRIFNGSFDRGGRCYAGGASWQNITKAARHRVTIDGEATVELDFASLHPALLYAEAGAPMPGDPYAIDGWPRELVKVAMLTAINARNPHAARFSIAHSDVMAELVGDDHQAALRNAAQLLHDITEAHRPIARAFFSDAGARLMRTDSDMVVAVMLDLHRQGIVALPVHDSFLVAASKRDALETAMLRAAHDFGLRNIRIKQA